MNDRSPWLPLKYKYLQLRSPLQNKQLRSVNGAVERIHSRAGLAHFYTNVLEFDARLMD